MVSQLKDNLRRVAKQAKMAMPLPIKMQHAYQYSKWDAIHEPYNVVENVLKDDDTVYKGLTPDFDFTLDRNELCYISEVIIWPGDNGPSQVQLFVSNQPDKWTLKKEYYCSKSRSSRLVNPGEYLTKYLRVRYMNNIRGGNIVNVRLIMVKGLNRNEGVPQIHSG